jgi:hypothetical protein
MMDEQELNVPIQCSPDGHLAGIHGHPQTTYFPSPGHLEAVQGIGIIGKTRDTEGFIDELED